MSTTVAITAAEGLFVELVVGVIVGAVVEGLCDGLNIGLNVGVIPIKGALDGLRDCE